MAQRIAGVAYVKVDGNQYPLRGNLLVGTATMQKTGIAGQDGVHGYSEMPAVPFIELDVSLDPGVSMEDLQDITDATVTAELANGKTYTLRNAWTAGARDLNTTEGSVRIRWEGMDIVEF